MAIDVGSASGRQRRYRRLWRAGDCGERRAGGRGEWETAGPLQSVWHLPFLPFGNMGPK